jgi:hypothetical protein
MLRYRFDRLGQLVSHVHVLDNSALMFLRDHRRDVHYARVLLELSVRETGQQATVRGEVVARADGSIRGVWLRLSDAHIIRRLCEPEAFSVRTRSRVSTDQLVQLRRSSGEQVVAQALDVSTGGLRVRGARGLMAGECCFVHVIGAPVTSSDLGVAEVIRTQGIEAGMRFSSPEGASVVRLVRSLQQAWGRALELDHLPECCAHGRPIEPTLPDLRSRAYAQFS